MHADTLTYTETDYHMSSKDAHVISAKIAMETGIDADVYLTLRVRYM